MAYLRNHLDIGALERGSPGTIGAVRGDAGCHERDAILDEVPASPFSNDGCKRTGISHGRKTDESP